MRLAIAAVCALICAPAHAELIQRPPPEYFARPYTGKVRWIHVPPERMWRVCGAAPADIPTLLACSRDAGPRCTIWMPTRGISRETRRKLAIHELAHCGQGRNGVNPWPADHPGATWE